MGGGRSIDRPNRRQHGHVLIEEAETIVREHRTRVRPAGIEPALIFKLVLHPGATLDEDELGRLGLTLISRDRDKTLAVFGSDGYLNEFLRRLRSYSGDTPGGPAYANLGGIERIEALTPEDRIGRRLAAQPIGGDDQDAAVDVELWHPGSAEQAREYVQELEQVLPQFEGRVTDSFVISDLAVVRCRITSNTLDQLLDIDWIREVDRIPSATLEPLAVITGDVNELPPIIDVPDDAPGVLIIDSGVTENHPMLRPALGEARAFPDRLGEADGLGPEDGEQRTGGHGTSVSGIAVYGDVAAALGGNRLQPSVSLFSARVLDRNCEYDPDELVEHQLENAVRYFLDTYPECRVVNVSLGDDRHPYRPDDKQFRLAARIDSLAYELQARNVLFVISSGNWGFVAPNPGDEWREYPRYLLSDVARVIDPATAALALTVGGLATGGQPQRFPDAAGRRAVAGEHGYPSPFTRTGPAVDGMIKPDLVEQGGDGVYDPTGVGSQDPGVGITTTRRDFAPPGGSLFRRVAGTSFAAPAVSHAAARLFDRYPEATPNLVRALLSDSARVPDNRPSELAGEPWSQNVLRVYGYGRPDFDRAAGSDQNDTLLIAEGEIAPDSFQLFEIPPLPAEFLETTGRRQICVSLAYDPPTRHTRGDSYVGVAMQARLFRNCSVRAVEAAFRDWERAPAGPDEETLEARLSQMPSRQRVDLRPGVTLRSKGTLQKGVADIRNRNWSYDGGSFILAVSCLRKWAPEELAAQRFAVVASVKHSDPAVHLYATLRQRVRPRLRQRVR